MIFKSKSKYDFLIAGLGNMGLCYEGTRHNAGFAAIDRLAKSENCEFNRHKFDSVCAECEIAGKKCILIKPQTYMNNSGTAVSAVCNFYKIPYENVIIMFDDISLDVGKIRIRRKGSAGGHNGIKDIIALAGTEDIMRIKIGVGQKPHPDYDLKDWVLSKIPKDKSEDFEKATENAAKAVKMIIEKGIDTAMNTYSK